MRAADVPAPPRPAAGRRLEIAARVRFAAFDLEVADQIPLDGITALFGPSGGGKSTLLRVVAGLERAETARVSLVDDEAEPTREIWADAGLWVPPHRRPVGTVFQDARLFPHLSVAGNLAYAERRSRARQTGLGAAVTEAAVIDALDLAPLLDRRPGSLSGGERQRVALGRTLLTRPRLLLLDEPLSALDRGRKADILPYLRDAPRRFALPAIYVTHAVEEIAQIADWVVALSDGRIRAQGPTAEILERLDLQPLTGRFEAGALIDARVTGQDADLRLTRLDLEGQSLTMPMLAALSVGDAVRLRVRARDVALATGAVEDLARRLSIRNLLAGRVAEIAPEADTAFAELRIEIGAQSLRARITRAAVADLGLTVGAPVVALVKSASFDRRAFGARALPDDAPG